MAEGPELRTGRLLLRRWRPTDVEPMAAINADPVVMEHFPSPLDPDRTAAFIDRTEEVFDQRGFGWWAVEVVGDGVGQGVGQGGGAAGLIGMVGLSTVPADLPCAPAVETGWRLAAAAWGHGYATEAALAAVAFGFEHLGLDEIVAFTVPANLRSQAVMCRLGMTTRPEDDFDHPGVADGHRLRRHVLYRLRAAEWAAVEGDTLSIVPPSP